MTLEFSTGDARRLALSSLGFGAKLPAKPGIAHVRTLAARLNAFQIDSVNVLVRAHYMPAFSRLGPYPMRALDELAYAKRELFEFWGHAACLMPMTLFPYFRWRMEAQENADYWGGASKQVKRYVGAVYDDVAERGPLAASEVKQAGKSSGNWWGWSDGKRAIETLWRMGRVAISGRRGFERLYDITERVIPKHLYDAPAPSADDAKKHLLVLAATALGVGTARDIAGYFHLDGWWDRQRTNGVRRRSELPRLVRELVDDARLVPASVDGWIEPAYVTPKAKVPASLHVRALVSPFDPVMWDRVSRKGGHFSQRLFGLDYTIEIYVPSPKRVYGYYVLPFLLGDRFAARVDLKADRKNRVLLVPGAFVEPGADPKHVAPELARELRSMADWLELERIIVGRKGNLARALGKESRRAAASS